MGSVPAYYNYKPSARRLYLFEEAGPLWPFGFGLSYTSFKYGGLSVTPARIPPSGKVNVAVTVTNTGKRAADEVVQLYIHDVVSSVTRPVQELKGFRRIHLGAGEAKRVEIPLGPAELSFIDEHMKRVVEPGYVRNHGRWQLHGPCPRTPGGRGRGSRGIASTAAKPR